MGGRDGGGGRELVAPTPQGSDILSERLVSLVAIRRWFPLHGLICVVVVAEGPHGSFDTVVAEAPPFDSMLHGSSMKKKSNQLIPFPFFLLFEENWFKKNKAIKIIK